MNQPSILPPDFHCAIVNNWALPPNYRNHLSHYYLLHWSLDYFLAHIGNRADRCVEHNGKIYVPVYKSPFTLDTGAQIMLSFRAPLNWETSIMNYVLIKSAT